MRRLLGVRKASLEQCACMMVSPLNAFVFVRAGACAGMGGGDIGRNPCVYTTFPHKEAVFRRQSIPLSGDLICRFYDSHGRQEIKAFSR